MGKNKAAQDSVNKMTIVILGEGGVGKSSITLKFIRDEFYDVYDPTIDDSYTISIKVDDTPWQIEVLDTAGQEEYRGLWVEHAASQGDAFIVTYAINSVKSFRSIPSHLKLIRNSKSPSGSSRPTPDAHSLLDLNPREFPFPFAIAANKVDLIEARAVPVSEGISLAQSTGGLFYECSAKTNVNIRELFNELIRSVAHIRQAALAHRKNPKTSNRRFIPNIGYQSSLRSKPVQHIEKPEPCLFATRSSSAIELRDRYPVSPLQAHEVEPNFASNSQSSMPIPNDKSFQYTARGKWTTSNGSDEPANYEGSPKAVKSCYCLLN